MSALLAGLTLLIVGDSHVTFKDSLLSILPDELTRQGARVVAYGVCSSQAADWVVPNPNNGCGAAQRVDDEPLGPPNMQPASPPPIASLIDKWHPNVVMVVLGDTMASYGQESFSREWVDQQVKTLTYTIGKTACIWVGPTWGQYSPRYGKTDARATEMAAFLKGEVAPCAYIDGTALMKPGTVQTIDGIHATPASYKVWGDLIVNATVPLLQKVKDGGTLTP
ncbi:cell morphology protein [Gluconacetobacter johannae DSM 13595]|uniref:SGNH/GDSL hydrolase family protein n=1 Tax=Gluconacetobacter johannae TaxID=112140 RepID=A0A7W4J5B2_9PROT|nr:SGNH/GDSL hydrolase family protein [Gluconacetobacter johannae]MBB2174906.1 SGNH/GDSL hydrolase family protein [Gluconacetobacter johannae]GBQ87734.1 cell morphology protein [Gluconacetobacter johannae DSM 13595]